MENNLSDYDLRLIESYKRLQSVKKVGRELGIPYVKLGNKLRELGVTKPAGGRKRHTCTDDYFSYDTPDSFYWAGFLATDGCLFLHSGKYKQVKLGLATKDRDHLEKFVKAVEYTGKINDRRSFDERYNKYYYSSGIAISSTQMYDDLLRFNLTPRKTHTYTFPSWLINHPLVNHFMRGCLDGDGGFEINISKKEGYKIAQLGFNLRGTKKFLIVYRTILERECEFERNINKPRFSCGIYSLGYGGNRKVGDIRDFLYKDSYPDIHLTRKYNIAFDERFVDLPEDFRFKPIVGQNIETGEKIYLDCMKKVAELGFTRAIVSGCCRKLRNYHKGYIWRFKEDEAELDIAKVKVRDNTQCLWTPEEIKYLKDNFKQETYVSMAKHLNRTRTSVRKKANKLGLRKTSQGDPIQ